MSRAAPRRASVQIACSLDEASARVCLSFTALRAPLRVAAKRVSQLPDAGGGPVPDHGVAIFAGGPNVGLGRALMMLARIGIGILSTPRIDKGAGLQSSRLAVGLGLSQDRQGGRIVAVVKAINIGRLRE